MWERAFCFKWLLRLRHHDLVSKSKCGIYLWILTCVVICDWSTSRRSHSKNATFADFVCGWSLFSVRFIHVVMLIVQSSRSRRSFHSQALTQAILAGINDLTGCQEWMTEVLYFTARSITLELKKSDEVVVQSRWQANTDVNTAQPKSRSSEFTCSHKSSNLVKKNNHDDAGQTSSAS